MKSALPDAENCWHAVMEKDSAFDGLFVYAVHSTGIYCRPSCSSRRPRQGHVEFFAAVDDAETAGYRACKRCRPRDIKALSPQVVLVRETCRYIEDHLDDDVSLAALGAALHTSAYHLQRTFKHLMGISPKQYTDHCRLERFKAELKAGQNVTGAIYEAGYGSSSRVYQDTAARLGMTPAAYRKGGRNMSIHYVIAESPLGKLLVAGTDKGVCAVSLGDSPDELKAALSHDYPAARIEPDRGQLGGWVTDILRYLDGKLPHLDLPLDIQATAFQQRVWEELRKIPYGQTRSYSEVARQIGQPTATRAVARACAANPAALVIPCHRVKRENGDLGGYRWGIERKEALLETEREMALQPVMQE